MVNNPLAPTMHNPHPSDTDRLLARLRAGTSEAHAALDRAHGGGDFPDLESYGVFLDSQARVFPAAEIALAASEEFRTMPDWRDRLRTPALMRDLARLDRPPPEPMALELDHRPGAAAGLAYVLEGSRLGGRLISRRLAVANLAGAPVEFITHGEDRRFWPSFMTWLSQRDADAAYAQAAVETARATFALFEQAAARKRP